MKYKKDTKKIFILIPALIILILLLQPTIPTSKDIIILKEGRVFPTILRENTLDILTNQNDHTNISNKTSFYNWLEQAERDLMAAEKNLFIGEYYLTNFLCQQSIEKALKAFYIVRTEKKQPLTHNLKHLSNLNNIPDKFNDILGTLTIQESITRYPDEIGGKTPYKLINKTESEKLLIDSKELFIWIYNQTMHRYYKKTKSI